MILGENIGSVYSAGKEIQRVYSLGKLVWEKKTNDDIDYSEMPFTVHAIEFTGISFTDEFGEAVKFNYSLNGGKWKTWSNSEPMAVFDNNIISIKANNAAYCKISGLSDIYGNIMSLLYGDNYKNQTVWFLDIEAPNLGYFENSMIRNAKNLILPATTLTPYCYAHMFYNCTSLITAPKKLPATTLTKWCYSYMFRGCTSLTTAPELPATTLASDCYHFMFYNCTSLITAPKKLPATTLAEACYYYMFRGCTSLTTAPELPATTLAEYCYRYMFAGCTSLTTAPKKLPATTLAEYCYEDMFSGCDSLTTAPELPATTLVLYCYTSMFSGCTNLNYIKCKATGVSGGYKINECINYLTKNVSPTGTLVCYESFADDLKPYIPSTWTVEYITE